MATKRVFPIWLDGDVQNIDASTGTVAWNGTTSRVVATPTGNFEITVGDADVAGTLLCVANDAASGSDIVTVTFASPMAENAKFNVVKLNSSGESVTAMYTGSEWFFLGGTEAIAVE